GTATSARLSAAPRPDLPRGSRLDPAISTLATTVRFDHPAQQIVLQDYIHAVEDAESRRDRLTRQIEELMPSWSPRRSKRCAGSLSSPRSRWWPKSVTFDASPMLAS